MGYRKKYHNLRITRYDETPSGKKLVNKFAVVDGSTLVSSVRGLTKTQASKELEVLKKAKKFVFSG